MVARVPNLVRLVSLLLLYLTVGCAAENPAAPTPIDLQLTLAPGQTAGVEGTGVGLRFDRVTGDSRCPIDAICVQGGDASVHITVLTPGEAAAYELHTGSMQPVRHRALTIELVDLQPYPFSARPVEPSEYRATLRVTR